MGIHNKKTVCLQKLQSAKRSVRNLDLEKRK